jgi:hypothetical protein
MKQQQAVITHIVKSQGVTDAQLQAALSSSPITSFTLTMLTDYVQCYQQVLKLGH